MPVATLLERRAQRQADAVALTDETSGVWYTIADLDRLSTAAAAAALAAGVTHGDRVGVLSANHPDFVCTYLGLARIGAVLVPLNWRLADAELQFIAADAGLTALVAEASLVGRAAGLADAAGIATSRRWVIGDPAVAGGPAADSQPWQRLLADTDVGPILAAAPQPDDLLYLMYTSGTTGRPKGAMHTHATTISATVGAVEAMDYRPGDTYYNVMPLFHVASLAMVNICLYRRCRMVLGRAFDPAGAWRAIATHRVDAMMAVPVMLTAMAASKATAVDDAGLDTSCLRVLSSGAAPVPLMLLQKFHGLGIDIVQAYGLTELGGAVSVLDTADAVAHLGSAGKALLSLEIRIDDGNGSAAAAGVPGEVVVRGPSVTTGYWRHDSAATDADGWFRTGDVGILDHAGFLTICDRVKDMVISGGENVYSAEVESVLLDHPAVLEVAVIAQPSVRWGESPCAVIVADDSFDAAEVLAWTRERLAAFKLPRVFEIVPELPRNASGKVLKHLLRHKFPGPAPE